MNINNSYKGLDPTVEISRFQPQSTLFNREYKLQRQHFIQVKTASHAVVQIQAFDQIPGSAFKLLDKIDKKIHGERFVPIFLGEGKSVKKVFVKVSDLSQQLGVSKKALEQVMHSQQENHITELIRAQATLKELNQRSTSPFSLKTMQEKFLEHGPDFLASLKNLEFHITDKKRFSELISHDMPQWNDKMVRTIIDIGKTLGQLEKGNTIYVKKDKVNDRYGYTIMNDGKIYIRYDKLGQGTFKKVLDTMELTTKQQVVSAAIVDETQGWVEVINAEKEFKKEFTAFELLKGIDHIVPAYEVVVKTKTKDDKNKMVAIQTKLNGDCAHIAQKNVTPYHILSISLHVATALSQIHKRGLIHSDVKAANILIRGDVTNPKVRVEGLVHDFGLLAKPREFRGGTPVYLPPEINLNENLSNQRQVASEKIDSFSFGVTLVDMLTGSSVYFNEGQLMQQTFSKVTPEQLRAFIEDQTNKILSQKQGNPEEKILKVEILKIAEKLLHHDPDKRLSCKEAAEKLEELTKAFPFPVSA